MNGSQDVNLNATECLRTVSDFGVSHVHNICKGTVTDVVWGTADWAIALGLSAIGVVLVVMVAAMALTIIRDA